MVVFLRLKIPKEQLLVVVSSSKRTLQSLTNQLQQRAGAGFVLV